MSAIERRSTPAAPATRRKRPKREYESTDMTPFVSRIARSMVRRAADGDLDALSALVAMSAALDDAARQAGAALHEEPLAYSWTEIADHLGISRQAARQRFGSDRKPPGSPEPSQDPHRTSS